MKLLALSDIHNNRDRFSVKKLPEAEVLCLVGDLTEGYNAPHDKLLFQEWMQKLKDKYAQIFFIFGNHDKKMFPDWAESKDCVFLEDCDSAYSYRGYDFAGVNMSPCYNYPQLANYWRSMTHNWEEEKAAYSKVPKADIVLSHSPPIRALDRTDSGSHIGSLALLQYISEYKPQIVLCGHVHEQGGLSCKVGNTTVYNVAKTPTVIEI